MLPVLSEEREFKAVRRRAPMKMNSIQTGTLGIPELQGLVCSWSSSTRRKKEGSKNVESDEGRMRSNRVNVDGCERRSGESRARAREQGLTVFFEGKSVAWAGLGIAIPRKASTWKPSLYRSIILARESFLKLGSSRMYWGFSVHRHFWLILQPTLYDGATQRACVLIRMARGSG